MHLDDPEPSPPFALRAEWPFVLALAVMGLATRLTIAIAPWDFMSGDEAGIASQARHIWQGRVTPIFQYGQAYMGTFGPWLMAPMYGLLGADIRGIFFAHLVEYLVAVPICYRLLFAVGGRWGAIAGGTALALGTYDLHRTAAWHGYFELLPLTALAYLAVARAAARGASDTYALGLGSLLGLGLWINPQFAAPTLAALVGLVAASPVRALVVGPTLVGRVGRKAAIGLRGVLLILLTSGAAMLVGTLVGKVELGGGAWVLTVTPSMRHMQHIGIALVIVVWLTELYLGPRRCALVLGTLGVFAIGLLPYVAYRLMDGDVLTRPSLDFSGEYVRGNVPTIAHHYGVVLLGRPWLDRERLPGAAALIALAAAAVPWAAWRLARDVASLARAVPARWSITSMLAIHLIATTTLALLHRPHVQLRYINTLWVPYIAALAASVGWLARRPRTRPLAVLALGVTLVHYGSDFALVAIRCREADPRPDYVALERALTERGATVGYAQYDHAHLAEFLTDERLRLTTYGGWIQRIPETRELAAAEPRPVAVFDLRDPNEVADLEDLLVRRADRIIERWERWPWSIVRLRRNPNAPRIVDLQGEPWRD